MKDSYPRIDPQLRVLEEENERLKRIFAKQALELEVKSELLKKHPRVVRYRTSEKLTIMSQFEQQINRTQPLRRGDLPVAGFTS